MAAPITREDYVPGCPVFFTPGEIAARLGTSLDTIYKWMASGQLEYRLWYRGKRAKWRRVIDSDALAKFQAVHFPKYSPDSTHITVVSFERSLESLRKGQRASVAVRRAKKLARGPGAPSLNTAPPSSSDEQSS